MQYKETKNHTDPTLRDLKLFKYIFFVKTIKYLLHQITLCNYGNFYKLRPLFEIVARPRC